MSDKKRTNVATTISQIVIVCVILVIASFCINIFVYDDVPQEEEIQKTVNTFANLSRTEGVSHSPRIMLDNQDNPHVFWQDGSYDSEANHSNLVYTKWNGSSWVTADNETYDPMTGNAIVIGHTTFFAWDPAFTIDPQGDPHIFWFGNKEGTRNDVVFYTKHKDSQWLNYKGESYKDNHKDKFISDTEKDAFLNTASTNRDGDIFASWFADKKLVCANIDEGEIKKVSAPISSNDPIIWMNNQCKQNEADEIFVCWVDEITRKNINIIKWDGIIWKTMSGAPYEEKYLSASITEANDHKPEELRLEFDSDGNPCVFWLDVTKNEGNHDEFIPRFLRWNGNAWDDGGKLSTDLSKFGVIDNHFSFSLDKNDNPGIVFGEPWGKGDPIKFARWDGENWVGADDLAFDPQDSETENFADIKVPENPTVFRRINKMSLAFDSKNNPHFVWRNSIHEICDIYYLFWNGEKWTTYSGMENEQ
ncbi:MAG: hypothetical protein R2883_00470 [Caldisericia bacterium]